MGEVLTKQEMEGLYDGEWVLIENPEVDEHLRVRRGVVLWHSKSREELYRKALELRPAHSAIIFFGLVAEEGEVVL